MGLFQTYMLTLAQQMYRGIDRKDWVGLSKQMFAQAGIVGASSLPGFHNVSEMIGKHFSDNHVDLESGLFRAVGDEKARLLLYGLPSSIGPGVTTRGDIQPRVFNPIQGLDTLASYNIISLAWSTADKIASVAFNQDGNTGRAVMEALSMQSVSRPLARWSELYTGNSLSGTGDIVANGVGLGEAVAHPSISNSIGIMSRVMATRPVEEIAAREAKHLDSTYKAYDMEKRKAVLGRLKTMIRDETLDPDKIQKLQLEYLKTGSPSGWRSAVNEALMQKTMTGTSSVKNHLRPDAPYQQMVDDIDP